MGDRRLFRRVMALLGVVLIAAAIGVGVNLRHQDAMKWNRLQAQVTRFVPPAGWTVVGQARLGSYNCLVSCDSPNITIVYRTTATAAVACDQLQAAVTLHIARAATDALASGCGWQSALPQLGGPAFVNGGAQPASNLGGPSAPAWTTKVRPTGTGTLAWVEFNAGLT